MATLTIREHCETLAQLLTDRSKSTYWVHTPTQKNAKYFHIRSDYECMQIWAKIHKTTGAVKGENGVRFHILDYESRNDLFDHADPFGRCLYSKRYLKERYLHNYRTQPEEKRRRKA